MVWANSIVSDQWVGLHQHLPVIRRIRYRLCIANHPCVEDDLALDFLGRAEPSTVYDCSVLEN